MLFGKNVNKYYLKYFLFFFFGLAALIIINWVQLKIPKICGIILDGIGDEAMDNPDSLFNNPERINQLMIQLADILYLKLI